MSEDAIEALRRSNERARPPRSGGSVVPAGEVERVLGVFGVLRNGDGRLHGSCPACRTKGFLYDARDAAWSCAGIGGCGRSGYAPDLSAFLREHVGTRVADVQTETVRWLWERRVPLGKITVLDGDPGLGKSLITVDVAARVSRGAGLPDGGPVQPGNVLLMNAEDGPGDTIRPRLEAANADVERITILGDKGVGLLFPRDLERVRAAIVVYEAVLLVIDPIMAHLDSAVNSHRDQDVRAMVMAPLAKIAEKTGAAIVLVRHLNKGAAGNPLYRGGGSIGFVGAARSGLLVAQDPDDETRRVLAPLKSNLSLPPRSLSFTIVEEDGVPRVEWLGESGYRAATLLQDAKDSTSGGRRREEHDRAVAFITTTLSKGAMESEVVNQLAAQAGISNATLWRARDSVGVKARKQRGTGKWTWALPEEVRADLQR